jgi:hypothetical protein
MVAGISGAGAGSGAAVGPNDGRLTPPQAPSSSASAEAIPRLATARALHELTMAFPQSKFVAAPVPQPIAKLLSEQ